MGEVFEAEDTRLNRRVALKVLPPEVASNPERRARFEQEARAVASLNHPNIVTIYSVEEAEGVHFLTMELVQGKTLSAVVPPQGLPLDRLLELAIPLADAVGVAHQRGITHRDLKPENILVDPEGRLKVLDFGLAKLADLPAGDPAATKAPTVRLTQEGRILGTVAYMSPEQAEGKPVDPRSDVFSLGIVLYEIATGRRPFAGDTSLSLLSSILKDTPPPVTDLNRGLPKDLSRIVSRCLAKSPAERFQSAVGLRAELAALKREADSGEVAGGLRSGRARALRRKPVLYAGAAALAVALGALLYLVLSRGERPVAGERGPGAPADPGAGFRARIVVLPFQNLGSPEDEYFAAGVTEEITSRLAAARELGVISRTSAVRYAKTEKSAREIGAELGVDYILEGTVRWDRGPQGGSRVRVTPQLVRVADDTHVWSDRYDRSLEDIFAVQSEIAGEVVRQLDVTLLGDEREALEARPTENLEAYQAYLRGLEIVTGIMGGPSELALQAQEFFERAVELDPGFALAWAALSRTHSGIYHERRDLTEERLSRAREAADRALRLEPDSPDAHLALGYYYYWGRRDYRRALEELEIVSKSRANDSQVLSTIAYIWRRQGRFEDALANLEKAYRLNPRYPQLLIELAGTYGYLRRYAEADRHYDILITLAPESPYPYFPKAENWLSWKGDPAGLRRILARMPAGGDPGIPFFLAFVEYMNRNYRGLLDRLAETPLDVLDAQDFYLPKNVMAGWALQGLGDADRARSAFEAARELLEKAVRENPRDPRIRSSLGIVYAHLGRKEEAVREGKLAVDIYPVSLDALGGTSFEADLARIYTIVGDHDAALDLLERLLSVPSGIHAGALRVDPLWDPLRDSPRFRSLLEKHSAKGSP